MLPFRFLIRLISLIIITIFLLPIILLIITYAQNKGKRVLNKKTLNTWSRVLCVVCGLELVPKGKAQENPVLIVANHVSWLDIPVINSYKLVGFVAKAEIDKWPFLGIVARCGESLFITRGKKESRNKVLAGIKKRLSQGRSIAVFPEGRATDGNKLGRFHRQLIHAAIEEEKPIQAIAIKYITPEGKRNKEVCFKGGESFVKNVIRILSLPTSTVELTFCEVINTKGLTARKASEITHQQVAKVLAKNDYL